ncbi:precorrin-6y C5,15-methyltransferase (decarboxylating), CbiE subunit [Hyphomicrobium denitrificans ATCC 51888]|uniref:Precorrin-6y C5,15-methyltransferase (Decarboxylating), CbiE subunit n=1 Tax=Hyphomicrobium denitrificans (strain ATCC 51888 / DSM 1869 / NCIMB 11706 / TK 0415) TaxID=582899 RepID=D8JTU1_HYPDA|nr:bifunctional cobalt-precorrin-7 (C(5))-methyltransferase/cobalt-precorrin-6B (C(15))-methyltransferase [Hyphomicrobium denitrificans]ADJ24489.1 precorrin-6y C5,15-methyltransferase (decarboxylating), CbiE subunit [Hyphomicrobium denitrificans ATCC 51888]
MSGRWLSIIGIGEDGRAGLGSAANALIDAAELIVGGERHLALVGDTRGEKMQWRTPLDATSQDILARRGKPVAVLVSGDPFWFGAGVTLTRAIPIDEMLVVTSPSSFSLAASRLGWALQDTVTLGLNMRGLTPLLRRHVHHGRRILALALNGETPGEVAKLLTSAGYGPSTITVLEALGGPRERIRSTTAEAFALTDVDPLNVIAIDVVAGPEAMPIPYAAGLPDTYFENDGQLTKREVRAVTLSSLQPGAGELLWDIGAGSGSVGIEWMLAHPANRAIGIERDETRAARAVRNAVTLGVPQLDIRKGAAPDALDGLPSPDAIFIGCGSADRDLIGTCWNALKPGGRIVVNSVTLESELAVLAAYHAHGGTLTRFAVERAEPLGKRMTWRPALPIIQWVSRKPGAGA